MARFDEEDRFLGWDAIEGKQQTLPTGVPLMVVMQFFVLQKKTKSGSGPREAKDPYWEYADQFTPQANKCSWVASNFTQCKKVTRFSNLDYRPNNASKGVVKNVMRQYVISTEHGGGYKIGDRFMTFET